MTTMELIERGIGHNCLSDAYDLGRADAFKKMYYDLANKYTNLWDDASDSTKNRPEERTDEAQCGYECIEATWTMAISILNDTYAEQLKDIK